MCSLSRLGVSLDKDPRSSIIIIIILLAIVVVIILMGKRSMDICMQNAERNLGG